MVSELDVLILIILSHKPSPYPQNTCGLLGQPTMPPRVPSQGYIAGLVFHGKDKTHIAPLESEVQLAAHPRADLPMEAEECDPLVVGTHTLAPLLEKGNHRTRLPLQRNCP